MYRDANGGTSPSASYMPSVEPNPVFIVDVIGPYVDYSEHVFKCPSDVPRQTERPPPNTGRSYFQTERSSYHWPGEGWLEYGRFHRQ